MKHYAFPCEADILARILDFVTGRGEVIDLHFVERGRYYRVVCRFDPAFEDVLYGIMKERYTKFGMTQHSIDASEYWKELLGAELYT
jgi:hypothetical protein